MAQTGGNYFYVFAHTLVAPESLADALRRAVSRVDPSQAVYRKGHWRADRRAQWRRR
jgi:hypothetical protein